MHVDDREPVGQLYADKEDISKTLLQQQKEKGMALLHQRSLVETVFYQLKNMCQIEHTRHRSPQNFIVNLLDGIVAYCLIPSKPKLAVNCSNIVKL